MNFAQQLMKPWAQKRINAPTLGKQHQEGPHSTPVADLCTISILCTNFPTSEKMRQVHNKIKQKNQTSVRHLLEPRV